jgi:hypothetical protein
MLFVVYGRFVKDKWDSCKKQLKNRKKKADVKAIIELMAPGDYRFTGVYDSKDATSLYKYLKKFDGLDVTEVMPGLPLDNILIIDEMGSREKITDSEG